VVATLGSATDFRNGRQLAAWLGLVPMQHSTGGRTRLGTISCRGDAYLRTLLIQGARSSLQRAKAGGRRVHPALRPIPARRSVR
jgi:transposase